MKLQVEIMKRADAMQEELVRLRRDFHHYPESGWTEFRTASIVAATLSSLGYEVLSGEQAVDPVYMMGCHPLIDWKGRRPELSGKGQIRPG